MIFLWIVQKAHNKQIILLSWLSKPGVLKVPTEVQNPNQPKGFQWTELWLNKFYLIVGLARQAEDREVPGSSPTQD